MKIKGKFKVRYGDEKPLSWCYKEATPEQLASRVKAGLIREEARK
jgi:hypothetical protein